MSEHLECIGMSEETKRRVWQEEIDRQVETLKDEVRILRTIVSNIILKAQG